MILRASVLNPRSKARRKTRTYPNTHPPTPLKVMLDLFFYNTRWNSHRIGSAGIILAFFCDALSKNLF